VSNPDPLTPWNAEPAPQLPLLDFLSRRSEIGFCADCLNDGRACPDHQQDTTAPWPRHPLSEGLTS